MSEEMFRLDGNRQERMIGRIDAILAVHPERHQFHSRQDVLFLAVDQLWQQMLENDSERGISGTERNSQDR
jgi:hypothetical protein